MKINKQDKNRIDYLISLLGTAISVFIGIILYNDGHGLGVSLAVGYGLLLLNDISKEVAKV